MRSRSSRAAQRGLLPMMTVSITRYASNAYWSCESTPIFFGRTTLPFWGSISPVKTFIKVDLPAPFGPVRPYRRPLVKVTETSSKSSFCPYRIVTLETEIMVLLQVYREIAMSSALGRFWWWVSLKSGANEVADNVFQEVRSSFRNRNFDVLAHSVTC